MCDFSSTIINILPIMSTVFIQLIVYFIRCVSYKADIHKIASKVIYLKSVNCIVTARGLKHKAF